MPPTNTAAATAAAIPARRNARQNPPAQVASTREERAARFRHLVRLYRVFTRLRIEHTRHGFTDHATVVGRQLVEVEEDLERGWPVAWPHLRPKLTSEEASWWAEAHDADVTRCSSCRLITGNELPEVAARVAKPIWQ